MDLNRLLRLAGLLKEDFTEKPSVNTEIADFVAAKPAEERVVYRDAMEMLHNAGPEGLAPAEWAGQIRRLHGDANLGPILKDIARNCPYVARIGDKRYAWQSEPAEKPMSPDMEAAISGQISLAYDAMKIIKDQGELNLNEWGDLLARHHPNIPRPTIIAYLDHVVNQFRGVLEQVGKDRYRYTKEETQGSMDFLRNLAANPNKDLKDEPY